MTEERGVAVENPHPHSYQPRPVGLNSGEQTGTSSALVQSEHFDLLFALESQAGITYYLVVIKYASCHSNHKWAYLKLISTGLQNFSMGVMVCCPPQNHNLFHLLDALLWGDLWTLQVITFKLLVGYFGAVPFAIQSNPNTIPQRLKFRNSDLHDQECYCCCHLNNDYTNLFRVKRTGRSMKLQGN